MKPASVTTGEPVFHGHRLVSLWEIMERIRAHGLFGISKVIENCRLRVTFQMKAGGASGKLGTSPDKDALANVLPVAIDSVNSWCVGLELTATLKIVEYIIKNLKPEKDLKALLEDLQILQTTMTSELEERLVLFVAPTEAKQYEVEAGFGEAVHVAFPTSRVDIAEAGTCFALGRYTASVYHAMCALEPAIASLAKKMKVQHSERQWKTVLAGCGKTLRS